MLSNRSTVAVYLGGTEVQQLTWVPFSRVLRSEEELGSEVRIADTFMVSAKELPVDDSFRVIYVTQTSRRSF